MEEAAVNRYELRLKLYRASNKLDNFIYDHKIRGRLYAALTWPSDERVQWLVCHLLVAHEATEDSCMKPEHDYCLYCGTRLPFQAKDVVHRIQAGYYVKESL